MPDQPAITLRPPVAELGDGSLRAFEHALARIAARLASTPPQPVPSAPPPKEAEHA